MLRHFKATYSEVYPVHLQLYGVDLPWVTHATHLGHELHQDCTMEYDAKMKRADFIRSSTDMKEMLGFANPLQVLNAVSVYSVHFYSAMNLYGDMAGQVYRSWNTCVKLAWGHTTIVLRMYSLVTCHQ
jgi:hypothetical protein